MSMTVIFVYETKSTSVHSQFHPINHWNNVMYYMGLGARYNIPSVISLKCHGVIYDDSNERELMVNFILLSWSKAVVASVRTNDKSAKQSYAIICEYVLGDVIPRYIVKCVQDDISS